MKIILIITLSFLAAAVQLTILPSLAIWSAGPNLALAGALAFAIARSEAKNFWLIMTPVILLDFLTSSVFGILALSVGLTVLFVDWLANFWFKKNDRLAILLLIFGGVTFFEFSRFSWLMLFSFLGHYEIGLPTFYFYAVWPIEIIYSTFLCLGFNWLISHTKIYQNHGRQFAGFR